MIPLLSVMVLYLPLVIYWRYFLFLCLFPQLLFYTPLFLNIFFYRWFRFKGHTLLCSHLPYCSLAYFLSSCYLFLLFCLWVMLTFSSFSLFCLFLCFSLLLLEELWLFICGFANLLSLSLYCPSRSWNIPFSSPVPQYFLFYICITFITFYSELEDTRHITEKWHLKKQTNILHAT